MKGSRSRYNQVRARNAAARIIEQFEIEAFREIVGVDDPAPALGAFVGSDDWRKKCDELRSWGLPSEHEAYFTGFNALEKLMRGASAGDESAAEMLLRLVKIGVCMLNDLAENEECRPALATVASRHASIPQEAGTHGDFAKRAAMRVNQLGVGSRHSLNAGGKWSNLPTEGQPERARRGALIDRLVGVIERARKETTLPLERLCPHPDWVARVKKLPPQAAAWAEEAWKLALLAHGGREPVRSSEHPSADVAAYRRRREDESPRPRIKKATLAKVQQNEEKKAFLKAWRERYPA